MKWQNEYELIFQIFQITETELQGKLTTYKRKPVPGKDDVYNFIPLWTEGEQRIKFQSFLDQIQLVYFQLEIILNPFITINFKVSRSHPLELLE